MMFYHRLSAMVVVAACAGAAPAGASEQLSPEQFREMYRLIRPQPGESKWARVSWRTNLEEARRLSAAQDRPLLLWRSGGGDVLGRT